MRLEKNIGIRVYNNTYTTSRIIILYTHDGNTFARRRLIACGYQTSVNNITAGAVYTVYSAYTTIQ